MMIRSPQPLVVACSAGIAFACAATATAQSTQPAVFVANNGNLEGSVSSLQINADGSLTLVDKLVTGVDDEPGTNAYTLSLSPNGRYIATGHTTSNDVVEQLNILQVNADATLTHLATFTTPDSPLDVEWITDEYLAVTKTSIEVTNEVLVYHFDPDADEPTLTLIDSENTGDFTAYITIDPQAEYLVTESTFGGNTLRTFTINKDGTLDPADTVFPPSYALGPGISPDGTFVYAGGGISNGGDKVIGYFLDRDTGELMAMPGSPYTSPGSSPKQVVVSGSGEYAIVGHGTDATVRVFDINNESGELTSTGYTFDVGFQGSLGSMTVMDDLIFFTDRDTIFDGVRGVYSFTINNDGTLTQNGPLVDTEGIGPNQVVAWPGLPCPQDIAGDDGEVNTADLLALLEAWGACPQPCPEPCPADFNGDCTVNTSDLLTLLDGWGPCR